MKDRMDNKFEISVTYKGKEELFPARLVVQGYIYKIEVEVFNNIISYERDETNQWRALVQPEDIASNKTIKVELLQAVADSLDKSLT